MKEVLAITFILLNFSLYAASSQVKVSDTIEVVNEHLIYKVHQDAHNLNISVRTSDKEVIMTMLRRGVTVYFDIKGKKKKNVYVQYPNRTAKPNLNAGKPTSENRPDIAEIIEKMPNQAFYKNFDIENQFHIGLNALDIALSFSEVENETLEYKLRIPKSKITSKSKKDFSKLSIGMLVGGKKDETIKRGGNTNMSLGQQRGSRGGGQMPPGGGGQGGPGKPKQEAQPSMNSKVVWLQLNK